MTTLYNAHMSILSDIQEAIDGESTLHEDELMVEWGDVHIGIDVFCYEVYLEDDYLRLGDKLSPERVVEKVQEEIT